MKLILSRKGFDSGAGGVANPILPDGRLLSLPIPDPAAPHTYGELSLPKNLIRDLTRGKLGPNDRAHLDPDLDPSLLPRLARRRALFGQHGAAAGHLTNKGVGAGDLFLFFGWFRRVHHQNGHWRFVKDAPDQHLLFGWFQVGKLLHLGEPGCRPDTWMRYHAHFYGDRGKNNQLYVASERLKMPPFRPGLPGAGLFPKYHEDLVLTQPGQNRGSWRLPGWFHPEGRASRLSYHERPERWRRDGKHVLLQAAFRGQEFVLDCEDYPEAHQWLVELLKNGKTRKNSTTAVPCRKVGEGPG